MFDYPNEAGINEPALVCLMTLVDIDKERSLEHLLSAPYLELKTVVSLANVLMPNLAH